MTSNPNIGQEQALERWPGYNEQSWSERFAELDRQHSAANERLIKAIAALSTPTPAQVEPAPRNVEVNRIAKLLLDTWKRVDPESGVAKHYVSYVATFADMARAIVDDREARPPAAGDSEAGRLREADLSRQAPRQRAASILIAAYGPAGEMAIRENAEASAIHNCAVNVIADIMAALAGSEGGR